MAETIEVDMPSGAKLKVTPADYKVSWSLFQSLIEIAKDLKIDLNMLKNFDLKRQECLEAVKDLVCSGLSSKKVEACLADCMKRALYNDLKIDNQTFDADEARGDYIMVCVEVAKANLLPFLKTLMR